MSFTGFGKDGLKFLTALAFHQERAWFEANRATYEAQLKAPMADLVADLDAAFRSRRIALRGDPKKSIFRIHRDVRFSKDKSPYKTHIGATLTGDGSKLGPGSGVFYLHVQPRASFVAAGFYHPEPDRLRAFRTALVQKPKAWKGVLAKLVAADLTLTDDEALTRPPRGYASDDPDILAALKMKSFVIRRPVADKRLFTAALTDDLVQFATEAQPLFAWGRAIQLQTTD